jgi:filamentous hemagglutinin family protein
MIRLFMRTSLPAGLFLAATAIAGNVTVDTTLKSVRAGQRLSGPVYGLDDDAGIRANQNLLISLKTFDLDRGESALFFSSLPTRNIITRITGGTASHIDGAVVSQVPGADLFLINPLGMVIGPHATFEVGGSLHVSTAQTMTFADGTSIDLRGGPVPTLTTASAASFGFLSAPASISVRRARIAPPLEATNRAVYSFTGGDIGLTTADFTARNGLIAITSVGSAGSVDVPQLDKAGSATFATGGRLTIQNKTVFDAENSGQIVLRGAYITVDDAKMSTLAGEFDGKSIDMTASRALRITGGSSIKGNNSGSGDAPRIALSGKSVILEKSSVIGNELAPTNVATPGGGGEVVIDGTDVLFQTGGKIVTSTSTPARSGNVSITARRSLTFLGLEDFFTGVQVETLSDGSSGDIHLAAPTIDILRSAQVQTRTKGNGNAGNVTVSGGNMTLDAEGLTFTGLASRAGSESTGGNGGTITVDLTGDLLIRRGGAISATTFGPGNGGAIDVRAQNITIAEVGAGNRDEVTGVPFNGIFSRSARTVAAGIGGAPGTVSVVARETLDLTASSLIGVNATNIAPTARAGDVFVSAPRLNVTDHAKITAKSSANGGNVTLAGDVVVVSDHAELNAEAAGNGGSFTIAPAQVVVLRNFSSILALPGGQPEQTTIDPTATLLKSTDSIIQATSPVLPPDVDIAAGLLPFNITFTDAAQRLQADCATQVLGKTSTFSVESRGGLIGGN